MGRRADCLIAVGLFTAALVLQLAIFDRGAFYTDEGFVAQTATEINRGKVLYRDVIVLLPGPAAFQLLAAVFRLTGNSFRAERLAIAVMSSGLAVLLYLLGRGAMSRPAAILVGLGFLSVRLWAFPHWLFFHYASCASFFAALAFTLGGVAIIRRALVPAALAGAAAGIAVLAKQDVGGAAAVALGLAIVGLGDGRRVSLAGAFGAGAAAVVLATLARFAAAGALPALYDQTVRTAFRGYAEFGYLGLPPLWPLVGQDPTVRRHIGEYAPSILVTLYWDRITASALFRTTGVWDTAIKLVFHLPHLVLALAALLVLAAWSRPGPTARAERTQATLLVLYGAAALAAFSPPRDWVHLLILFHPTLLLGGLLLDRLARRLGPGARVVVLGLATAAVALALASTLGMTRDLRHAFATPVRTAVGTVRLPRDEAAVLRELLAYVDRTTAPADPLPVIPYHAVIQFLAGRTAGTNSNSFWPVRPRDDTDARLIADLEAARPPTIVYSASQYAHLGRFRRNFPGLFAWLVDHYEIVRTFTPPTPWGAVFCALGRRPPLPPPLVDLMAELPRATVSLTGPDGARVLDGAEREAVAGTALWPFRRVLWQRPAARGTSTIAFRLHVPPASALRFGYGLDPDEWVSFAPAAVTFTVTADTAAGSRPLFAATVDPQRRPAERAWREAEVDLGALGGEEIVFALHATTDGPAGERGDLAGWAEPRLVARDASRATSAGAGTSP